MCLVCMLQYVPAAGGGQSRGRGPGPRGGPPADGRLVEGAGARRRAGGEGGAAAVVKAVVGGETCGNRLLKRYGDAATYRYRY